VSRRQQPTLHYAPREETRWTDGTYLRIQAGFWPVCGAKRDSVTSPNAQAACCKRCVAFLLKWRKVVPS
jgi:hypothetical protein